METMCKKQDPSPGLRPALGCYVPMSPRNCPRLDWAVLGCSPVPGLVFTMNSVAQSWRRGGVGGGCWPLGQGDATLITSVARTAQPVPGAERKSSDVPENPQGGSR